MRKSTNIAIGSTKTAQHACMCCIHGRALALRGFQRRGLDDYRPGKFGLSSGMAIMPPPHE